MSTLATTLRTRQKSSGARGMIAVGVAALVAIAVAVVIVTQLGTSHPRAAAVTHHSAVQSRALGVSGTPRSGAATAGHPASTNVAPYHGTSAAGHQPGAVAPAAVDGAIAAASGQTAVPVHKSYGAVP